MSLENQNTQQNGAQQSRQLTPAEIRELKRRSPKAKLRRKRIVCFVLALLLLGFAALPTYRLVYQPYQAKAVYRYMKTLYTLEGEGNLPGEYNQQLGALYDVNPDIGGWLIVPGTNLNLPVAQTNAHDSVYYVNHLFDGTANPYGTPYFMTDCTLGQVGHNTVIRGGEKLMGELGGYRTLDYYKNAPTIFLDGLNDTVIYKIFAVVEVKDTDVSRITQGKYTSPISFHKFVNEMGNRSIINTGIRVEINDSLLTLLCDTEEGKLAIIARQVRDGEDYTVDTSMAQMNIGANPVANWQSNVTQWGTPTDVTPTDVDLPSDETSTTEDASADEDNAQ